MWNFIFPKISHFSFSSHSIAHNMRNDYDKYYLSYETEKGLWGKFKRIMRFTRCEFRRQEDSLCCRVRSRGHHHLFRFRPDKQIYFRFGNTGCWDTCCCITCTFLPVSNSHWFYKDAILDVCKTQGHALEIYNRFGYFARQIIPS